MPKIILPSTSSITEEKLFEICKKHFDKKYTLYMSKLPRMGFVLKKSAFSGVGFSIKYKKDKTIILYGAFAPSFFIRLLQPGVIPLLILWFSSWKSLQQEVKDFLEQCPDLQL